MHTVELLRQALETAQHCGYGIRHEWLATGTCSCEIAGRKWLFIDLAENALEQFDGVCSALGADPQVRATRIEPTLAEHLDGRRAA